MGEAKQFTAKRLAEFFQYLDDLRESGRTNMFGAGVYVQKEFGLDSDDARFVVTSWMKTFDRATSADDRAAKVAP